MNADCACYTCCRETFPKSFECWQPPDAITHYCRGKGMKPNLSRSHLESPALDSGLLCALKHMKLLSCTSQEVMLAPERLVHKSTYHKFQHRKTDYPRTVQPHNAPYIYIHTQLRYIDTPCLHRQYNISYIIYSHSWHFPIATYASSKRVLFSTRSAEKRK